MCGIAGLVEPESDHQPTTAEAMARALDHRGPDDRGVWRAVITANGCPHVVSFGHTRLSIIDLSSRAGQPMTADDDVALTFNGEIYNFRELRRELEELGRRFHTSSDTEVLLEAWREWGTAAFARLHGMFAFALWDAARQRLLLVRDRLGIKPLFYGRLEGGLLFGSELRALRRHPGFSSRIDRGALGRFLRYGCVSGPETIYENARRLMPGEYLVWQHGELSRHEYWSPFELPEPPPTGYREVVERLGALLSASVTERLVADVPLGALLSGGVDSSLVVSLMQGSDRPPVKTFTIGFREEGFDEAPWARAVAEHLGTEHTELYVGRRQALDVLAELPTLYDEPFGDASAIPTILVSRLARQEVKVVLSGDGGDELFGGYSRYRRLHSLERWLALPGPLRRGAAACAPLIPWGAARRALGHLGGADPADVADRITARFEPDAVAACCGAEAARPRAEFGRAFALAPGGTAKRTMFADVRTYLADDILVKLDRASMSTGLEARVPLLDHRVARFALSLPLQTLWHGGESKAPLRTLLRQRVPERLTARPKSGFGFPVAALLGRELERWTDHYLAPGRLSEEGIFDPAAIRRLIGAAEPGSRAGIKGLWHLLCFQRWFARVHRGEPGP